MVSLIRLNVSSVLAHEDEQREENRFQRYDRGQELVREGSKANLLLVPQLSQSQTENQAT
jgi:hypothetical protein